MSLNTLVYLAKICHQVRGRLWTQLNYIKIWVKEKTKSVVRVSYKLFQSTEKIHFLNQQYKSPTTQTYQSLYPPTLPTIHLQVTCMCH